MLWPGTRNPGTRGPERTSSLVDANHTIGVSAIDQPRLWGFSSNGCSTEVECLDGSRRLEAPLVSCSRFRPCPFLLPNAELQRLALGDNAAPFELKDTLLDVLDRGVRLQAEGKRQSLEVSSDFRLHLRLGRNGCGRE